MRPEIAKQLGRTFWFDLPVSNLADAMSFYEGLLGWSYQKMENSPLGDYVMIEAQGELIGGLRQQAGPVNPQENQNPILYFTVEHLAAKVNRAKELGAKIVGESVDLGKARGVYQWLKDREGHLIALWAPA